MGEETQDILYRYAPPLRTSPSSDPSGSLLLVAVFTLGFLGGVVLLVYTITDDSIPVGFGLFFSSIAFSILIIMGCGGVLRVLLRDLGRDGLLQRIGRIPWLSLDDDFLSLRLRRETEEDFLPATRSPELSPDLRIPWDGLVGWRIDQKMERADRLVLEPSGPGVLVLLLRERDSVLPISPEIVEPNLRAWEEDYGHPVVLLDLTEMQDRTVSAVSEAMAAHGIPKQ